MGGVHLHATHSGYYSLGKGRAAPAAGRG